MTNRWTDEVLHPYRLVGDESADALVARVYAQPGSVSTVNQLMSSLIDNSDTLPPDAPPELHAYFEETAAFPADFDAEKLARGQRLFGRYGPQMVLALHCASLPECYAAADGVRVLAMTARLSEDPWRRIIETAQFLLDTMAPNSFVTGRGNAIRTVQKVRLMHAAVRSLIISSGRWDAKWGVPINQEDQAGTLLSFSCVTLAALERIGIDFTDEEKEDYVYAWNTVGHFLGVTEEVRATSYADGMDLIASIRRRHHRRSDEGVEMTGALVDYMKYSIPGNLFDSVVPAMMRKLLGDPVADLVGVENATISGWVVGALSAMCGVVDELGDRSKLFARTSSLMGHYLLQAMVMAFRKGQRVPFRIPEELQTAWGVTTPPCEV